MSCMWLSPFMPGDQLDNKCHLEISRHEKVKVPRDYLKGPSLTCVQKMMPIISAKSMW